MTPLRIIKCFILTAGIIPAVFLTVSCQCVEDWFDRNKPEPKGGLTGTAENKAEAYTIEEAAAMFCNRLIMKFSMYYSGKPYLTVKNNNDAMAKKIAMQLYRAKVVDQRGVGATEKCLLHTTEYSDKVWHLVATDPKNGQILLSLSLPLKKE